MAIEFGNTGREIPGVGVLLSGTEQAILDQHRKRERRRMGPPIDRVTLRQAELNQVYIYNVGPFVRKMDTLGSTGVVVIPGLPEDKVLKGLSVAGPCVRMGIPEAYPSEPPGRRLTSELAEYLTWTDADGEVFSIADRPSIDEALRIIGGHEQSQKNPYSASPYEQGCFVSTIPEQVAPPKELKTPGDKASAQERNKYAKDSIQYEEEVRLWLKWEASVTAAQQRFTAYGLRRGEEQSLAFSNGSYVRDEELFVLSRILKKTVDDWKFLAGTAANVKTKPCWSCGRAVAAGIPKCTCGELQISAEAYETMRKERMAGVAA